jgi:hypothetical protein
MIPPRASSFGQDPLGFAAGDMNLYRYCGNNPVIGPIFPQYFGGIYRIR